MARRVPWFFGIFALAVVLHTIWAMLILAGEDPLGATPLHTLGDLVGNRFVVVFLLLTASALAAWSLLSNAAPRLGIAALIPQQILMLISGGGAIKSVVESAYADGVIRPQAFIGADQLLVILVAVIHTLALLWLVRAAGAFNAR